MTIIKKFNWGHGVTAGFVLFVGYIMYFVVTSFRHDVDLVAEDYYAQEVAFQDRINETSNAAPFCDQVSTEVSENGVRITFPEDVAFGMKNGLAHLFRPSDQALDLRLVLALDENHQMMIPSQLLHPGRYELEMRWSDGQKSYFIRKDIFI